MSAYMIDDETYLALYRYLESQEYYQCHAFNSESPKGPGLRQFINELREANNHSVNSRYRENTKLEPITEWNKPVKNTMSDMEAFKTMQSIDYQSCEFEEWPATRAWVGLQEALAHAGYQIITKMKEYSSTAWR